MTFEYPLKNREKVIDDPNSRFRDLPKDIREYCLKPSLSYDHCPELLPWEEEMSPCLVKSFAMSFDQARNPYDFFLLKNGDMLFFSIIHHSILRFDPRTEDLVCLQENQTSIQGYLQYNRKTDTLSRIGYPAYYIKNMSHVKSAEQFVWIREIETKVNLEFGLMPLRGVILPLKKAVWEKGQYGGYIIKGNSSTKIQLEFYRYIK